MSDEDIGDLLRELRHRQGRAPSSDFTSRVLGKLDARTGRGRRARGPRRALALGFAASLVGVALLAVFREGGRLLERVERSETAERVRELRAEYRDLQAELDKLKALTQEIQPVLDLGGTEQVDFVLDLRDLPRERDPGEPPAAAPASHSSPRDDSRRPRR